MDTVPISSWNVEAATEADIPGVADVYLNSFNSEFMYSIFPPTDGVRKWYETMIESCLKPQQSDIPESRVMLIRSPTNEIISFAVYRILDMSHDEASKSWRSRWPSASIAPELTDEKLENFFGPMEKSHMHLIGDRKHVFLEVLGTAEKHQKQGCASVLIKWGTGWADELGLECYLDASALGKPLYEKFGYTVQDVSMVAGRGPAVPMIRLLGA
ncbi:acyl-CoA N-acyltransferase [Xylariales sp. PMI_506]|nr:acyl-CoA N-acyltransferase [Xylariales sp. PMI_506]